jgi:hypothetical protein
MRGSDDQTASLLSYVSCEARVPADHPLRVIRAIVDQALSVLSATFDEMYAQAGRPSIASKKLLRVLPFQAFYLIRSERQLMEQLDYNLLFHWFVRWRRTRRCGTPARSAKIATAFWKAMSRAVCWRRSSSSREGGP